MLQSNLVYNAERKLYVSPDLFDTDDKLGVATLQFLITRAVAPYPPLKYVLVLFVAVEALLTKTLHSGCDLPDLRMCTRSIVADGANLFFLG